MGGSVRRPGAAMRTAVESQQGDANAPFAWLVRVYYEDTDAGGIVYYASYLRFLERARTEWLRAAGVSQWDLAQATQVQFVVRRLTLDFIAAARLDDMLAITVQPLRLRTASFAVLQEVRCADKTLCRAEATLACVRKVDLKPVRLPHFIAKLLQPLPASV